MHPEKYYILVVDDAWGYDSFSTSSGKFIFVSADLSGNFIEQALRNNCIAIFADRKYLFSPEKFIADLKNYDPLMEIVVMGNESDYTDRERTEEAVNFIKSGVLDYILKPVKREKLSEMLSDLLKKRDEAVDHDLMETSVIDIKQIAEYNSIKKLFTHPFAELEIINKNGKDYLLKTFNLEFAETDIHIKQFLSINKAVSGFEHEDIIKVCDYGISDVSGKPFVIMENIDAHNLLRKKKKLSLTDKLKIIIQITEILNFTSNYGVIHTNLHPNNVLIIDDIRVNITDWGSGILYRILPFEDRAPLLSDHYHSPEFFHQDAELDAASDIFSLGIIMYELLSGEKPFKGTNAADIRNSILNQKPLDPVVCNPEINSDLQKLMSNMLVKDRTARFQFVEEVAMILKQGIATSEQFTVPEEFGIESINGVWQ